jgi:hypothetical protein
LISDDEDPKGSLSIPKMEKKNRKSTEVEGKMRGATARSISK